MSQKESFLVWSFHGDDSWPRAAWCEKDICRFEGIQPRDPKILKRRVRLPFMDKYKDQLYVLILNDNRRRPEN